MIEIVTEKYIAVLFIVSTTISLLSCSTPVQYRLDDNTLYENSISPQMAYKKAEPHLANNFLDRCNRRIDKRWCAKKYEDLVFLDGNYYFISRESYPYKTIQAYLVNAIKVHKASGTVILPEGQIATHP